MKTKLVAPCGMNCNVCSGYLRTKNRCPGCNVNSEEKPKYCINCKIKNCQERTAGARYCFECEKFPCPRLKQLNKRYETKYKTSLLGNLMRIKEVGVEKFMKEEEERWKCKECQGVVCIHKGRCTECGKEV